MATAETPVSLLGVQRAQPRDPAEASALGFVTILFVLTAGFLARRLLVPRLAEA